ncbi:MAG: TonB-dependent receptor plug domain-containing protein [Bacteroidales bacterium]|nr:TonB-dependent receptor plug domain-containing protein [Bacteroidales bacterium]
MKQVITVLIGVFISSFVFAQNKVVYGKLTTFNTYPVQNVEVTTKKAKTSVTSDSLGQFSIVCFENDIIRIRPKTFKPVNKRVGPDTDSLFINLLFIDSKANRELAVGYGYINKEDLIYAVNHLEQENNDFCSYANIFDLIRGRFSGVRVTSTNVYIRGSASFTGQIQALYIVNGVATSSIDWISPCQIKSIDILKDSNAAIYGTRGGNGVVIINTNK